MTFFGFGHKGEKLGDPQLQHNSPPDSKNRIKVSILKMPVWSIITNNQEIFYYIVHCSNLGQRPWARIRDDTHLYGRRCFNCLGGESSNSFEWRRPDSRQCLQAHLAHWKAETARHEICRRGLTWFGSNQTWIQRGFVTKEPWMADGADLINNLMMNHWFHGGLYGTYGVLNYVHWITCDWSMKF